MRGSKNIELTSHALGRIELWKRYGFAISQELVEKILLDPDHVYAGYGGRKIAQGPLDDAHVLRIIFEERRMRIIVVTVYPGRRSRYG